MVTGSAILRPAWWHSLCHIALLVACCHCQPQSFLQTSHTSSDLPWLTWVKHKHDKEMQPYGQPYTATSNIVPTSPTAFGYWGVNPATLPTLRPSETEQEGGPSTGKVVAEKLSEGMTDAEDKFPGRDAPPPWFDEAPWWYKNVPWWLAQPTTKHSTPSSGLSSSASLERAPEKPYGVLGGQGQWARDEEIGFEHLVAQELQMARRLAGKPANGKEASQAHPMQPNRRIRELTLEAQQAATQEDKPIYVYKPAKSQPRQDGPVEDLRIFNTFDEGTHVNQFGPVDASALQGNNNMKLGANGLSKYQGDTPPPPLPWVD